MHFAEDGCTLFEQTPHDDVLDETKQTNNKKVGVKVGGRV